MHALVPVLGLLFSQVSQLPAVPTPAESPPGKLPAVPARPLTDETRQPTPAVRPSTAEPAPATSIEEHDSFPRPESSGEAIRSEISEGESRVVPAGGQFPIGREAPAARLGDPTRIGPGAPSDIRPATVQEPLSPVETTRNSSATLLLKAALQRPEQEALSGRNLKLREALDRAAGSGRVLDVVRAYWRLSHAIGQYHYCLEERQFLADLPSPADATSQLALRAALSDLGADLLAARVSVTTQQHELAEAAMLAVEDELPLSADEPWVGVYRTNFERLFAGRTASPGVRRIDRTLPQLLELIDARAETVLVAADALLATAQAYTQSQVSVRDVLAAQQQMSDTRRRFLVSIRDYNLTIADYAIQGVGQGIGLGVDKDTVLKMLIEPAQREKSVLVSPSRGVRTVSDIESLSEQPGRTGIRELQ